MTLVYTPFCARQQKECAYVLVLETCTCGCPQRRFEGSPVSAHLIRSRRFAGCQVHGRRPNITISLRYVLVVVLKHEKTILGAIFIFSPATSPWVMLTVEARTVRANAAFCARERALCDYVPLCIADARGRPQESIEHSPIQHAFSTHSAHISAHIQRSLVR